MKRLGKGDETGLMQEFVIGGPASPRRRAPLGATRKGIVALCFTVAVAAGFGGYAIGSEVAALATSGTQSGYDHLNTVSVETTYSNDTGDVALYDPNACTFQTCQSDLPYGPNLRDWVTLSIVVEIPSPYQLAWINASIQNTTSVSQPSGMGFFPQTVWLGVEGHAVLAALDVYYPPNGETFDLTLYMTIHMEDTSVGH